MVRFRKISKVRRFSGALTWHLSEDCLLAAQRVMYTVEYRRFYLRDLESVIVWPNRLWLLRPLIPGLTLGGLGVLLWWKINLVSGAIFAGLGVLWAGLEVALGPTTRGRVHTSGAVVDLPIVARVRRAGKVLDAIDRAVVATRAGFSQQQGAGVAADEGPSAENVREPAPARGT